MRRLANTLALVMTCAACNGVLGNEDATLEADAASSPASGSASRDVDGAAAANPGSVNANADAGSTADDASLPGTDAGSVTSLDSGAVCPANQTMCDALCVDLRSDPLHCGTCTTVCAAPPMCTNGKCKHGKN